MNATNIKSMKKENALEVAALDCSDYNFTKLVKFSLIDLIINTMRIITIPVKVNEL